MTLDPKSLTLAELTNPITDANMLRALADALLDGSLAGQDFAVSLVVRSSLPPMTDHQWVDLAADADANFGFWIDDRLEAITAGAYDADETDPSAES